jgi:uncharacterized protein (TIGR02757 family)
MDKREGIQLLLEVAKERDIYRVDWERPDPLLIARNSSDDRVALVSALFAYGNVKAILKFLQNLNWELLEREGKSGSYYRFQNREDVSQFFRTLRRIEKGELEEKFWEGYRKEESVIEGLHSLLSHLYNLNPYRSRGYLFLLGKIPQLGKSRGVSPYKRWMMFFRWMVRRGEPDLGRWKRINPAKLIIPLDTHTHKVGLELGLLQRKSYDLESAYQLTQTLRQLDSQDPLRFDFPLYRIGQLKLEMKKLRK